MPYYRFEDLQSHHLNPHLSTTQGPVIEGRHMFYRRVTKKAGQASRLHYHPNEFMAFLLEGKFEAVLGADRRTVTPGTLVHIPSNAQHSFRADGDIRYLYIKDRTWTLIGAAADEPLPEKAKTATEVAQQYAAGEYPGREKDPSKSQAIVEGLGNCFYPMVPALDAPAASAHHEQWVEGANLAFAFVDSPAGHETTEAASAHELFAYVISGTLDAEIAGERRLASAGDVLHVPKGAAYRFTVPDKLAARYAVSRSTSRLETEVARNGASDNWRG